MPIYSLQQLKEFLLPLPLLLIDQSTNACMSLKALLLSKVSTAAAEKKLHVEIYKSSTLNLLCAT